MKYYYSNFLSNIAFLMKNFEINLFFMFSAFVWNKRKKKNDNNSAQKYIDYIEYNTPYVL